MLAVLGVERPQLELELQPVPQLELGLQLVLAPQLGEQQQAEHVACAAGIDLARIQCSMELEAEEW